MKSRTLRNKSAGTIVVSSLRNLDGRPLVIPPGGTAVVCDSTFNHPVLRRYMGRILVEEIKGNIEERPTTPPPKRVVVPEPTPVPVQEPIPIVEPVPVIEPTQEPELTTTSIFAFEDPVPISGLVIDVRSEYLKGPGVTVENVAALLSNYPTKKDINAASKKDLIACGVAKSYASRLKEWAAE